MVMALRRCRLLVCLSLAIAIWVAPSLSVGATSGPLDTAMELVATSDWDTALYALDMASRESVELNEMLRAALWKAVILRSLIEGDFVMYSMLYDGGYAATGSDKDSLQSNRTVRVERRDHVQDACYTRGGGGSMPPLKMFYSVLLTSQGGS